MEWKEYRGYNVNSKECFPEGYEPTELEEGKRYLVCTDKGNVYVKEWYGHPFGGFRTTGAQRVTRKNDTNVLFYADITLPEEFVKNQRDAEIRKLREQIAKMQARLKVLKND